MRTSKGAVVPSRIHSSLPRALRSRSNVRPVSALLNTERWAAALPVGITAATLRMLVATVAMAFALMPVASAAASSGVPVTPFVDCVAFNGDATNPVYTAYFGFNNTGPVPFTFAAGAQNVLFPGSPDVGQPTQFDPGNYPRVFASTFDGMFLPSLTWSLNGTDVAASANSPVCTPGVTTPASDLGSTSATINGAVVPDGQDTTYGFEYGTSQTLGSSTPVADAGTGTVPQLVQGTLTGLAPSTKYYFRLVTTNATDGTTHSQLQSFTTLPSALMLSVPAAPHGTFGVRYAETLTAAGGNSPYTWNVTAGALPPGLSLNTGSGVISGTPTAAGTADFTVKVTDSATPSAQTVTRPLSITIDPAATTTHLSASPNPVTAGRPVTYTAVVSTSPSGLRTPTGTVTFSDNGAPAHCRGGSQTLSGTGVASCTLRYTGPGAHAIVARYGGARDFAGSDSQALSEIVTRGGRHHHQPAHLRGFDARRRHRSRHA
jgi:hypothetical protein